MRLAGLPGLFACAFLAAGQLAAAGELPLRTAEGELVAAFMRDCGELVKAAGDSGGMAVEGRDGWLFLQAELRHVSVGKFWGDEAAKVSKASRPEWADPLPAIVDFENQLRKHGVELVLVPVPAKAHVYPEMVSRAVTVAPGEMPPRLDVHHLEFYELLRRKGVKVLDLLPELVPERFGAEGATYCRQDTHWSGRACELAARALARELAGRGWLKDARRLELAGEKVELEIAGDLWKALARPDLPRERLRLRFVGTRRDRELVPVEPDPASPVLLLADSHGLVFHAGGDMHARGAGFADQLALELGFALDVLAVRGSGATPARANLARKARNDPEYLSRKRLVIWCFSVREFTEGSGWRLVPVFKD